jgi:CheY-like chemotaxis protein
MRPGTAETEAWRVLIVEDDPILALDLSELLEEWSYEVCGVAKSGAAALKLAAQHRPRLALVDVGIDGGMDGIDLAVALRREFALPSIIVTGSLSSDLERRASAARPAGFLSKPYLPEDLEKVLREARDIMAASTS